MWFCKLVFLNFFVLALTLGNTFFFCFNEQSNMQSLFSMDNLQLRLQLRNFCNKMCSLKTLELSCVICCILTMPGSVSCSCTPFLIQFTKPECDHLLFKMGWKYLKTAEMSQKKSTNGCQLPPRYRYNSFTQAFIWSLC